MTRPVSYAFGGGRDRGLRGWSERISSLLPGALAGQLAGIGNDHSVYGAALSPSGAAAVTVAYIVVPLVIAAVLIHRRDA